MTGWGQTKLVRPVPRAKRLLADAETFGQLAQVLMSPSGEHMIHVHVHASAD